MTAVAGSPPRTAANRVLSEITSLKAELEELEKEEKRLKTAKALESEKREQERRRKQQLADEAILRETIELRKYQEAQRKDRLKRMREEAKREELSRLEKERKHQEIQWELVNGNPLSRQQETLQKKSQLESQLRRINDQDHEVAECRKKLIETLDSMKNELRELGREDWTKRQLLKQQKAETDAAEKISQLRQAEKAKQTRVSLHHDMLQSVKETTSSELSALKDELLLLEREDQMATIRMEASSQHASEKAATQSEEHILRFDQQRKRQASTERAEAEAYAAELSKTIDLEHYHLQRQLNNATIREENSLGRIQGLISSKDQQQDIKQQITRQREQKPSPDSTLLSLKKEAEELIKEEQQAEEKKFQNQIFNEDILEGTRSVKLKELLEEQKLSMEKEEYADLEDVIQYNVQITSMNVQAAADEIQESRKRLRVLHEEQMLQQERSLVLVNDADRAKQECDRQASLALAQRLEHEQEHARESALQKYEIGILSARKETDRIRIEKEKCLNKLLQLEYEQASAEEQKAKHEEECVAHKIRQEQGLLLHQNAEKRRHEGTAETLRKKCKEAEECNQQIELQQQRHQLEKETQAANTIQGLAKINVAKKEISKRRVDRASEAKSISMNETATVCQQTYAHKQSLKAVEERRRETHNQREQKALKLIEEIELSENEIENEILREEILQQVSQPSDAKAANGVTEMPTSSSTPLPPPQHTDLSNENKVSELEMRVQWLQNQLNDERQLHAIRENERLVLCERAAETKLNALEDERNLQNNQIDELTDLLSEHMTLIDSLQGQLDEVTQYGPYEEDRTRGTAAVKIQSAFKGSQARNTNREMKVQKQSDCLDVVMSDAARVIQGLVRTTKARGVKDNLQHLRVKEQSDSQVDDAATDIQRVIRGTLSRQSIKQLKQKENRSQ